MCCVPHLGALPLIFIALSRGASVRKIAEVIWNRHCEVMRSCHVEDVGEPCLNRFGRTGGSADPPPTPFPPPFGRVTARWVLMMVVRGLG
jgi:hypothetical protein